MAVWWKVNDETVPWEKRRIRQGDAALAGGLTCHPEECYRLKYLSHMQCYPFIVSIELFGNVKRTDSGR